MTDYALGLPTWCRSSPKDVRNPRVVAFLHNQTGLWLPSVVVFELEFGVQLLPQGQRRNLLRTMNDSIIASYNDRILPLERAGAEWAALYRAQTRRDGRLLRLSDALIAGIARANDLTVATRNVRDFEGLDVEIYNPWEEL